MPDRSPLGFGRRVDRRRPTANAESSRDERPWPTGATRLDDDLAASLLPERPARGHKGSFGKLLVLAGSLDYAGAALLVCRAAGRAGVGLVTLAVPESLQPLFAAKVVEATTMGLPEDDVEEVDPEPALARILDHEHDAHRGRPGSAARPGHGRARAGAHRAARRAAATDRARRRGPSVAGHHGRLVERRAPAGGPHPARRGVRAAARGQRRRARRRWRPRRRRRGPGRGRARRGGRVAPGRGAQGRPDRDRRPGRRGRDRAVREPGPGHRRDGRRPGRRDRCAAGPGPHAVRRRAARGLPARRGRRLGARPLRRRRPARVGPARGPRGRPQAPGRRGRAAAGCQGPRLRFARAPGGDRESPATPQGTDPVNRA